MNESQEPDDLEQVIERLLRDPVHGPRLKKRLKELVCRRELMCSICVGATQREP